MKIMLNGTAIAAMVCTAFTTLTAVVFCLSMGANSTPAQFRSLKLWMLGLTLLGLAGIVAGIFLLRAGQPGWAAGASIAPTIIMVLLLIISLLQ